MNDGEHEGDDDLDRVRRTLPHRFRFIGLVKNAWALDLPRHALPPAFAKARALLRAEGDAAMERAVALLSPYFGCAFDTCNVDPELNDFLGLRGDIYDAVKINLDRVEFDDDDEDANDDVVKVDVSNGGGGDSDDRQLPAASGAAWFELPAGIERSVEEMEAWQEKYSYLDCGLRFFWRIHGESPRDYAHEYDLSDALRLWVELSAEVETTSCDDDVD